MASSDVGRGSVSHYRRRHSPRTRAPTAAPIGPATRAPVTPPAVPPLSRCASGERERQGYGCEPEFHGAHFPLNEKYLGQFLTVGESPAKSPVTAEPPNDPSPAITSGGRPLAQGPVREVRAALQLQIIAPSWRSSHSGPDLHLSDFCSSLQSSAPTQAHLRSPSGASKQLNVALAFEHARNNAATMPHTRRANRISPSISHGGILTLDTCPRYQNSARSRRSRDRRSATERK